MSNSEKLKESLLKAQDKMKAIVVVVRKIGMLLLIAFTFLAGFVLGARMFETGNSGKLKGANITVSGICLLAESGDKRLPALNDDEVKVTAVKEDQIFAVIRKTREAIICDLKDVSYDTLPVLSKWGEAPIQTPELTEARLKPKQAPYYMAFDKQTLVVSGTCRAIDGKEVPSFTDEKIQVTSIEGDKENSDVFVLTGIRRSDKQALVCSSKAITYQFFDPSTEVVKKEEGPKSYIGKIILVDSRCMPDSKFTQERPIDPKTKKPIGKVLRFYNLLNTPVQVSKEVMNERGQLTYLEGKIVARPKIGEANAYGHRIICDSKVDTLIIKEFDSVETSLVDDSGKDVSTIQTPQNLDVVTEGEDAVVPQRQQAPTPRVDDGNGLQDLMKELEQ